jgi:hypothetical protein
MHGYAPYWQEAGRVADSLDDSIVMLSQSLRVPAIIPNGPLPPQIMTART